MPRGRGVSKANRPRGGRNSARLNEAKRKLTFSETHCDIGGKFPKVTFRYYMRSCAKIEDFNARLKAMGFKSDADSSFVVPHLTEGNGGGDSEPEVVHEGRIVKKEVVQPPEQSNALKMPVPEVKRPEVTRWNLEGTMNPECKESDSDDDWSNICDNVDVKEFNPTEHDCPTLVPASDVADISIESIDTIGSEEAAAMFMARINYPLPKIPDSGILTDVMASPQVLEGYNVGMVDGCPRFVRLIAYVYYNSPNVAHGEGTMAHSGGFFNIFDVQQLLPNTNFQCPELGMGGYDISHPKRIIPMVYLRPRGENDDGYYPCALFARVIQGVNREFVENIVAYLNGLIDRFVPADTSPDDTADYWTSQVWNRTIPLCTSHKHLLSGEYPDMVNLREVVVSLLPEGFERLNNLLPPGEITLCKTKVPSPRKPFIYECQI